MKRNDYDQMLGLYEQWQSSGESKFRFALRKAIRPTTFYYWTRKFEKAHLPIKKEEALSTGNTGFHRLSIEKTSNNHQGDLMAAIQYPSGTRLELYSSFQNLDSSYVELLKTLTD